MPVGKHACKVCDRLEDPARVWKAASILRMNKPN